MILMEFGINSVVNNVLNVEKGHKLLKYIFSDFARVIF